ncbi:MAG: hypothetical protein ABJ059_09975, partial [Hyphomicrobiales bacterium]
AVSNSAFKAEIYQTQDAALPKGPTARRTQWSTRVPSNSHQSQILVDFPYHISPANLTSTDKVTSLPISPIDLSHPLLTQTEWGFWAAPATRGALAAPAAQEH